MRENRQRGEVNFTEDQERNGPRQRRNAAPALDPDFVFDYEDLTSLRHFITESGT